MRLNAYLARAGVASRRKADELIKAGRVTVNGEAGQLNTFVGADDDVGRAARNGTAVENLVAKRRGILQGQACDRRPTHVERDRPGVHESRFGGRRVQLGAELARRPEVVVVQERDPVSARRGDSIVARPGDAERRPVPQDP